MKYSFFIFTALIIGIFLPGKAYAAKKFVRKSVPAKRTTTTRIPSSVKYRTDKRAILLSFSSFSGIESVSYSFTYNSSSGPQGAGGTVTSSNNPSGERELLFGTCSTSVCTYHSGIRDARLLLTAKYHNGSTASKIFRIKSYF